MIFMFWWRCVIYEILGSIIT